MTRNMVWLSAPLAQLVEHGSYEPGVAGSSPARSNIFSCLAPMAEWSKAVDLSPTISGCAGSNPAWCKSLY